MLGALGSLLAREGDRFGQLVFLLLNVYVVLALDGYWNVLGVIICFGFAFRDDITDWWMDIHNVRPVGA